MRSYETRKQKLIGRSEPFSAFSICISLFSPCVAAASLDMTSVVAAAAHVHARPAWERSLRPGQYYSEKGGRRPMRHRTQAVRGSPEGRSWSRGVDGGAWGRQDLSPIPSERAFKPLVRARGSLVVDRPGVAGSLEVEGCRGCSFVRPCSVAGDLWGKGYPNNSQHLSMRQN